jgi:hypothetical protein
MKFLSSIWKEIIILSPSNLSDYHYVGVAKLLYKKFMPRYICFPSARSCDIGARSHLTVWHSRLTVWGTVI